jgi:hypothetical protein
MMSRATVMRSSMNPSVQAMLPTGSCTAVSQAFVSGTLAGSMIGIGISDWAGRWRSSATHSSHNKILLARSVTSLEKRHQVGRFDDPLNVSCRAMYTIPSNITMDCAAAEAALDGSCCCNCTRQQICIFWGYNIVNNVGETPPVKHLVVFVHVHPRNHRRIFF